MGKCHCFLLFFNFRKNYPFKKNDTNNTYITEYQYNKTEFRLFYIMSLNFTEKSHKNDLKKANFFDQK